MLKMLKCISSYLIAFGRGAGHREFDHAPVSVWATEIGIIVVVVVVVVVVDVLPSSSSSSSSSFFLLLLLPPPPPSF